MDKNTYSAPDLLKHAKSVLQEQNTTIEKMAQEQQEMKHFKLAYDVADKLAAQDQIDEMEFRDTVQKFVNMDYADLRKRAEVLEVADFSKALELGNVEGNRDKMALSSDSRSERASVAGNPHSAKSAEAASSIIRSFINN